MNNALTYRTQSLTFRQWSRKSYAIFASLGKEVNIGHVDIEICDKAFEKNIEKKSVAENNSESSKSDTEDHEELLVANSEATLISFLTVTLNSDDSSQQCCIIITKHISHNLNFTSCYSGCRYLLNNLKE